MKSGIAEVLLFVGHESLELHPPQSMRRKIEREIGLDL